jgi:hypothetical protein
MQVGASYRAAEVPNAWWCRRQWCSEGRKERQLQARQVYAKGQKVAATRQWLREMTKLVRDLNKGL